jgi:uncharacterized protein YigA (DUF484 family)
MMNTQQPTSTPAASTWTEDSIVDFLLRTPDFFERHAAALATIQLTSPHGHRAVGLQERQAEMLREKIKKLELRLADMVRHANENLVIVDRLQRWASKLLQVSDPGALPQAMVEELQAQFLVPQVAIKLWGSVAARADASYTHGVSSEVKSLAASLMAPYCGTNAGFEAVSWLPDPSAVASVALVTLRAAPGAGAEVLGLMVLASSDAERFQPGLSTDFLERMAELGSAALLRLR